MRSGSGTRYERLTGKAFYEEERQRREEGKMTEIGER
jgi:hypothetical protein